MDIFPVSFYEYLFLFLLCFVAFLIGWGLGRTRNSSKTPPYINAEQHKKEIDLVDITEKKPIRAIQTRKRGGEAIISSSHTDPEKNDEPPSFYNTSEETAVHPEKKDDLKHINGIGPTIEKKLNRIGIYTFVQLSTLTQKDIEKVARYLETYPKKIEKEGWIQQARTFVEGSE